MEFPGKRVKTLMAPDSARLAESFQIFKIRLDKNT